MGRIIEPLASRCSKFRFRPLAQSSSQARIEMISKAEGVNAEDGVSQLRDSRGQSSCLGSTADPRTGGRGLAESNHLFANGSTVAFRLDLAHTYHRSFR